MLRWLQQRLDDIHKPGKLPRELILGDVLRFEFIRPLSGVIKPSAIQITRNGLIWQSASGWSGQCLSNGNSTQYVIGSDG
ncbi:MAG: hypothetical protein WBN41_14585 [Lysobacterales bacterium]